MATQNTGEANITGDNEGEGLAVVPVDNKATQAQIRRVYKNKTAAENDRKEANDKITALRDELVNKGFSKKAQSVVEKYMNLNETEQQFFFDAIAILCAALGKPVQMNLALENKAPEEIPQKKAATKKQQIKENAKSTKLDETQVSATAH